ncbi:hypothetical protein LCGC14_1909570, partial [marine sediment metagenome]
MPVVSKTTVRLMARGKRAAKNFREFVRFIAGFDPVKHQKEQVEACQDIGDNPRGGQKYIVVAPPGSGKSQLIGVLFVAWIIGKYPDEHVGLLSYADKPAWKQSAAVRKIIEESKPYHLTFPGIKKDPASWGSSEFKVRRKSIIDQQPTLRCGGTQSAVVSYRMSGLVFDDPISEKQSRNAEQLEKAFDNYLMTVTTRLIDMAWQMVIGTRWVDDDFIGSLLLRKLEGWKIIHVKALNDDGTTYWPPDGKYGYSQKFMEDKKALDPELFQVSYMGEPGKEGTGIIKKLPVYRERPNLELVKRLDLLVGVGWDSVAENMPVTVRINGYPLVLSFNELWQSIPGPVKKIGDREVKQTKGLEVLDKDEFVSVTLISRHRFLGNLTRVNLRHGSIDVTPNHSLINEEGDRVTPDKVDKNLPLPPWKDTPSSDIIRTKKYGHRLSPRLFIGSKELAWVCGLFVAEGSVGNEKKEINGSLRRWFGVGIANTDSSIRARAKKVLREELHVNVVETKSGLSINDPRADEYFLRFYIFGDRRSSATKSISPDIFNSSRELQEAFLEGYLDGDGYRLSNVEKRSACVLEVNGKKFDNGIGSKSPVLAQQLAWMVNHLYGLRPKLYTRRDKEFYKFTFVRTKNHIPSLETKDVSYDGYVYDLTTKSHTYRAGIGGVLVSNTAFKDKEKNDYSVGYVGGLDAYGVIWILYRTKGRFTTPKLIEEIYKIQEEWNPYEQWVEDSGGGTPAVQVVQAESPGVPLLNVPVTQGGKRSRAHALV